MLWVIFAIIAYFLFAVSSVIDETLLSDEVIKPKVYAFYIGMLSSLVLFLLFFDSTIPSLYYILIALLSGFLWIAGVMGFFEALKRYELSRVVPAIGAFLPLFTLILSSFYAGSIGLSALKIISFALLVLGGILIVLERSKRITRQSLKLTSLTALLFALAFFTAKLFYLEYSFLPGFIWMRAGALIFALFLLFFSDVRKSIFKKRKSKKVKFAPLFFTGQGLGAIAGLLQNLAIYFAPLAYLSFVNALEGIKYVFILILVLVLARFVPKLSFEKLTKEVIIQKTVAVSLIILGLILLAL